jgi:hypothetical protein
MNVVVVVGGGGCVGNFSEVQIGESQIVEKILKLSISSDPS